MADPTIAIRPNGSEQRAHIMQRGFSFISPVLAGLALAVVLGIFTHNLTVGPAFNEVLIFASGAAAAVLVLRLIVQRERRVALQRVVSEIVGENTSPEVAAMRILEALCVSQGWDVALKWEVSAEENQLEFCSGWNAPGRHTETLIQDSMGVTMRPADGMLGRVSAVNALFIGSSNQLGEFESGLTAGWWGAQPAVLVGGVATIAVALLWMRLFPALRNVQSLGHEEVSS